MVRVGARVVRAAVLSLALYVVIQTNVVSNAVLGSIST